MAYTKWRNCEKCEKMSTSLKCVCCHEIAVVKACHLKFKATLSWNTAVLEFFAVEFNCVGNHFLEEPFSEISKKLFLSISFNISKITPFQVFLAVILIMYLRKYIRFPKQLSLRTPLDNRHSI